MPPSYQLNMMSQQPPPTQHGSAYPQTPLPLPPQPQHYQYHAPAPPPGTTTGPLHAPLPLPPPGAPEYYISVMNDHHRGPYAGPPPRPQGPPATVNIPNAHAQMQQQQQQQQGFTGVYENRAANTLPGMVAWKHYLSSNSSDYFGLLVRVRHFEVLPF